MRDYIAFEKPGFLPKGMSEEELTKLFRRAYLSLHLNLKTILRILSGIKNMSVLKSYVKAFFWSAGLKK